MTFYMRESKSTDNRVCCRQSGENVGVIGKPSLRFQVFQLLNIADSTCTVNIKQKPALNVQGVKLCQLIQVQSDRCQGSHFATKRGLTFMPSINWSRIEHKFFFTRGTYDPRERTMFESFATVSANKQFTLNLEVLDKSLFSVAVSKRNRGEESLLGRR